MNRGMVEGVQSLNGARGGGARSLNRHWICGHWGLTEWVDGVDNNGGGGWGRKAGFGHEFAGDNGVRWLTLGWRRSLVDRGRKIKSFDFGKKICTADIRNRDKWREH